ncbi:MAG TPA: tetratricopeptide repeat protein, partial [Armatimonadota bacterium]|nr:tetratricopeptide repeat protein [Armatimonadota bacterium]
HSPPGRRIVRNYLTVLDAQAKDREIDEVLHRHAALLADDEEAKRVRAMSLLRRNRLSEARRALLAISGELSREGTFLVTLGTVEARLGHLREARIRFEAASRTTPGYSPAWRQLGICLNDLGDYAGAQGALETAVRLAPEDRSAWQALSFAAWKRSDWPLARRALQKLAALDPANPEPRQLLAQLPG